MRVLHTALQPVPGPSIINQLLWEQDAAEKQGIPWDVKIFCPKHSVPAEEIVQFSSYTRPAQFNSLLQRMQFRHAFSKAYYTWLNQIADHYDVILLRYNTCDRMQYKFVKKFHKKVYLVHHTLELPELHLEKNSVLRFARYWLEKDLGKRTIQRSKGVIGVTNEILKYEKHRAFQPQKVGFIYPNGVQLDKMVPQDKRAENIEIIFIASYFHPWHGLDLLLNAMKKTKESFVLHVVGDLSSSDKQKALSDNRIQVHGALNQTQIAELSARCSIGLSSLAMFRNQMAEGCPRKVREYLMLGLPVYAACKDVFDEEFPYYRENACDIEQILKFAREVRDVSKADVIEAAKPYISKEVLVKRLYQELADVMAS
ncbi:MAG: glycosyltransferase [Legionellaceae bacterium]|nr:glycosyltransferase [Legionellaceae bacterium]